MQPTVQASRRLARSLGPLSTWILASHKRLARITRAAQIGGDDIVNAYPYFMEVKIKTGKFRVITVKLIPEGMDISTLRC